ncbi:MAG: transporter substrate-binding domain-containing protein [Phoenicibacter congonensis]|uniref:Transporter substrate-binding domain-containing protein n=1 Tax=Phoenicibacter congonensis TaxID=1944646 RepID=A0AA43RJI7_9ACTN|nr:transporter substrate-binding domain-containing protein [Phoenicibacter congonensis]
MNAQTLKGKLAAVIAVLVCALMAVSLVGCSSGSSSDSSTGKTKLIVGFDQSYPPYGFIGDDGEYTGFDIDMAKLTAEKNGWDIELQPIDWDAKDALLDQGQINCIWNGFTIEGREGKYAFSEPYMINGQVVVVKADSSIKSLSDLAGKVVITQAESSTLELFEGDQKALADTFGRLDTISDFNNAFLQLDSGAVDAVACDLSIAQYQLTANPTKYVQLSETLSDENYAVGFKNDENGKEMAAKVTATLKELYADGTVKQLCEKYADYGMSIDNWKLK